MWLKRIRFLMILAALVVGGSWVYNHVVSKTDKTSTVASQSQSYEETAASAGNSNNVKKLDLNPIKSELQNYISGFTGKYGIYYYNLISGEEFGINEDTQFDAASTTKVPLNLYLYQKIKSGDVNEDDKLAYTREDDATGTGDIQYQKFGTEYSVKELSKLSITASDNVAANMLFRLLGRDNVKDYMRQVGGKVVDDEDNISSPKDLGLYMKLVYDFYLNEGSLGEELMDNFLKTEFNDRIPALLPDTVKVAHKIGTQIRVFNDVAIIFTDTPYVLAVMSDQIDEDQGANVIAAISKKIYDFTTSGPKNSK
ncbi:MAG: serine hydrolase [Bacillota bacterium]|nr:serine hydrolase [Bacillota bacterium]